MPKHPTPTDLDRLAAFRLERDLSFEALALLMRRAGCPMNARGLHYALTHRVATQPRETTRYKIARFLATLDVAKSRKTPKRRRAAA